MVLLLYLKGSWLRNVVLDLFLWLTFVQALSQIFNLVRIALRLIEVFGLVKYSFIVDPAQGILQSVSERLLPFDGHVLILKWRLSQIELLQLLQVFLTDELSLGQTYHNLMATKVDETLRLVVWFLQSSLGLASLELLLLVLFKYNLLFQSFQFFLSIGIKEKCREPRIIVRLNGFDLIKISSTLVLVNLDTKVGGVLVVNPWLGFCGEWYRARDRWESLFFILVATFSLRDRVY